MKILNAFSFNMIGSYPVSVNAEEVDVVTVRELIGSNAESAVGHADTAAVFADVLGISVPCARVNVSLEKGDVVIVGQYSGPRLPEGASKLPTGAIIKWLKVSVS